MDCFSDQATDVFGKKLRDQVEERLKFYDTGAAPRKNIDVMKEAVAEAAAHDTDDDGEAEIVEKISQGDAVSSEKKRKKKHAKASVDKEATLEEVERKTLNLNDDDALPDVASGRQEKKNKKKKEKASKELHADGEATPIKKEKKRRRDAEEDSAPMKPSSAKKEKKSKKDRKQ
jgi:nucleolar protein 56